MKLRKQHIIAIVFSVLLLGADAFFFRGQKIFPFLAGVAIAIVALPFLLSLLSESAAEKQKNEQFLEFTRNLAESVKTGTPIGKSIVNMSARDFGPLTPHIRKLANQIMLGVPMSRAFQTFANDVDSIVVQRAVTLIQEAENAGGEIDHILDSVAESIYQIEKLKRERKSAVSSLVVQGYVIFLIFIGIMLVMEFKILPLTSGIGSVTSIGSISGSSGATVAKGVEVSAAQLARPFLYLLLTQGFFAGLTIGKLSEGTLKSGIKHSLILTTLAFIISSAAEAFI
jgi:flagellar protein FlaJ